ncbi:MAG: LptF/LptG family permease [Desulfovibrio sp.]|jgi:lipopolysaccharide export system permease protein|nr:LptF/LptG family permease [Desulfovibrio sp.]
MTTLTRYLLRQNLFFVLTILLAGTGIYLLTDLFERLDNFLEAGVSPGLVIGFFLLKLPVIISQILPAVFLLATVIQLNLLQRTNEQTALETGGVSPLVLLRFVICYSVIWACGQFFFSQFLGITGDRVAAQIWQASIQGNDASSVLLQNRWLMNNNRLIHFERAVPALRTGQDLQVYTLDDSGIGIEEILRAKYFVIKDRQWELREVARVTPKTFSMENLDSYVLRIRQDIKDLQFLHRAGPKASQLPVWELRSAIRRLEAAGSNVEGLRTLWHSKIAHAASIVAMGLLALVISRLASNIYKAVGLSLILIFLVYSLNTLCIALGERGMLPPALGAWFADGFVLALSLGWLFLPQIRLEKDLRTNPRSKMRAGGFRLP